MVLPAELSYVVPVSDFLQLERQVAKLQPDGTVNADNRTASFQIPAYDTQLIHPHTVRLCGKLELASGKKLANSVATLIDSISVFSGSGQQISRVAQAWRLHSMLADAELDRAHADSHWQLLMDKRGDGKVPSAGASDAEVRYFSIPLNFAGLFSCNKMVLPADFGGLRVVVQLRSGAEAIIATASPSYTLSMVHLSYEYSDISKDQKALQTYRMQPQGGRVYEFTAYETYVTSVPSTATAIRVPCPTRYRSIRKMITGLFDGASGAEKRLRGNVASFQTRVGSALYPQERIDNVAEMLDITQSAFGGASRGILTQELYEGIGNTPAPERFMLAQPFNNLTISSGMDPRDATCEIALECSSAVGTNCQAVVFVQADAYWNSVTRTVAV